MTNFLKRGVGTLLILSTLTFSTANCGIILHPERGGRRGGHVDVVTVVLDCLWLLLGVVPGLIALGVDLFTGGFYEGMNHLFPGSTFAWNVRGAAPGTSDVKLSIIDENGNASTLVERHFEKGQRTDSTPVTIPHDLAPGHYKMSISVNGRDTAQWPVTIQ